MDEVYISGALTAIADGARARVFYELLAYQQAFPGGLDIHVRLAEDDEEVAGARLLQVLGHMEGFVHPRF